MALRVAHFLQRYPPALGGAEAYFARLSQFLADRGDQVTIFTTAARDLEAFWSPRAACLPSGVTRVDGVEVRRYPISHWPGRRYALKALSFVPWLPVQRLALPCNPISWPMWRAASTEAGPYDAIHASAFPYTWPIVCGLRLARRLHVPFFLTPFLHLGDPNRADDPTRRAYSSRPLVSLLRAADLVFAQTAGEQTALLDLGISADKIQVQGLGVEPAECTGGDRNRARATWGIASATIVVGHLANNSAEKGTVDLLQAADRLWNAGLQFRIVLAGPEMPNFQACWRNYPSKENVVRLGVLTEKQKRDFFAGLDVFALPSRSDSFGLVLLEAWANSLPNLAYRAGGIADVVRHEEDGLLAPCGDVAALTEMLRRLIGQVTLRQRLGETGRERAFREFRWQDKLELVRTAYEEYAHALARPLA